MLVLYGISSLIIRIEAIQLSSIKTMLSSSASRPPAKPQCIGASKSDACEPYIQQTSNRHLRRILAQFRTGSHWLNIETGRQRKQDRKDKTCPMCTHRIINPGLPPEEFDASDSDEECSDPIEDEQHAIFDCPAYADAQKQYRDLSRVISPLLETF